MASVFLTLVVNSIMVVLLLATIVYCLRLNKRIKVLQDSKSELAQIIREFDESTQRATQNINEIHAATARISENMQLKIDKANFLANDLEMMIERGNKMAGKVEPLPPRSSAAPRAPEMQPQRTMADIMPGRSSVAAAAATRPEAEAGAERRPLRMRSRAEQELINLIGTNKNNG